MKILIFCASGATGHELVKQGLALGHAVTAFVRTPEKLKIRHNNLNKEAVLCSLMRNPESGN